MEPKKKILVTGAAGALAKKVIDKLKKDYKVIAVDFRTKVDLGIPVESYKVDFNKR
ncbi:MAG: NAD-dependent epimerase, partial [Chitinophagales bacterium]|nr:NAD-dependent epimerase [Chitinophagales bacterium]